MRLGKSNAAPCREIYLLTWLLCLGTFLFAGISPVIGQAPKIEYSRLSAKQKDLFDNWVRSENQRNRQNLPPAEKYEMLSISQRASYEAITNALTKSRLTTKAGKTVGSPIDLISGISNIAGELEGEGGDKQFRIYVDLVKNSVKRLGSSKTFHRGKDNHIFHKKYPYNFRQIGKAPTLQISIASDGRSADIDIDYKSSSFPAALFNGHLKASNSDVRPKSHFDKHVSRWQGLIDWWDKIASRFEPIHNYHIVQRRDDHLSYEAIHGNTESDEVSDVIDEFLNLWIVRSDLKNAAKFFSQRMAVCTDFDQNSTIRIAGPATSRKHLNDLLLQVSRRIGKASKVSDALFGIDPHDPEIKLLDHKDKRSYALGSITRAHFDHFICKNKDSILTNNSSLNRNRYATDYVSIFSFKEHEEIGGGLIILWQKENGAWKIVSFDILTH